MNAHPAPAQFNSKWNNEDYVFFDFETSGIKPEYALQHWRHRESDDLPESWATCLVWGYYHGNEGKLTIRSKLNPTAEDMKLLLDFALIFDKALVGWNTVFDTAWLIAYGFERLVFENKWLDGRLIRRHAEIEPEYDADRKDKKSYGLKQSIAELRPECAGYDDDINFHDPSPEAREKLLAYNILDVEYTAYCTEHYFKLLNDRQLNAALIEAESIPLIARANYHGLDVDIPAAEKLRDDLQAEADKRLKTLEPYGVTEQTVRSPKQLAEFLFDKLELPVLKENIGTKTGKVSRATSKDVLKRLAEINPVAAEIKSYREALGNKTKFADNTIESTIYNGCSKTYPQAIMFGTYSGRLTYASSQDALVPGKKAGTEKKGSVQTGIALHQWKRGAEFRSVIKAPEGYTLLEYDSSAQEYRFMALASGDPNMKAQCMPGRDPHSYMAANISSTLSYEEIVAGVAIEDKKAKDARQLGKIANLSLGYRTGAKKLRDVAFTQYDVNLSMDQAIKIHAAYQETYPHVPAFWERQIEKTRRDGFVENFAGQRVYVQGDWDGPYAWSMQSTAINFRIQSTGAAQKALALKILKPLLLEVGGYFLWDLHDGIYMAIPEHAVLDVAPVFKKELNAIDYEKYWNFIPDIPLTWDCKIGKSWGALKEFKG